jgi:hypothetical protein
VLKDTYDNSCSLARWNEYHHLMTQWPTASRAALEQQLRRRGLLQREDLATKVKVTGLTQNLQVDPAAWLRIPIRDC